MPPAKKAAQVTLKRPGIDLIARYADDFLGFCALLDIIDDGGARVKLQPNRIQREYDAARTPRDVVLKPRQIGFTTFELARDVWFFLVREGAKVVIVCQTTEKQIALKNIAGKLRLMFDALAAEGVDLAFSTDSTSEWIIGDRSLRIIEAGESQSSAEKKGRSGTIHRLHFTETAFYGFAEATLNALIACVPAPRFGTEIVSECTPNGAAGVFYEQYQTAAAGKSGWRAHFYPWFMKEDYATALNPGERVVPESKQEHTLCERFPSEITPEKLKWYRGKVGSSFGNAELVDQEYPTDPETAFLMVKGRRFFDRERTTALLGKTRPPLATEMHGAFLVWKRAELGESYVVVADPSEGTGGDPGAAGVYHRRTGEHVAELHGQFPTWKMGELLAEIGHAYNGALLVVERNNHGHAVLQALEFGIPENAEKGIKGTKPYPNIFMDEDDKLGWMNTETSRSAALEALESAHRSGEWSTPDRGMIGEMFTFIVNERNGKAEAGPGAHDDKILQAAIAHDVLRRARPTRIPTIKPKSQYRFAGAGRGY
jgi:hypothetical protein